LGREEITMQFIKIVLIPPGFPPIDIQMQWLGVEIPLATEEDIRRYPPPRLGIGSQNSGGHMVLLSKAIEALMEAEKYGAVQYWRDMSACLGSAYLIFKEDVCRVIEH
jgi:hypothetical protein